MLDIDTIAQYMVHHGRLGSSNAVHGVAMNVALQVDHCSVLGYSLGHALGPHPLATCLDFVRVYVCVVALPGYYHEAIKIWSVSYPDKPFVECLGDILTIRPFNNKKVSDLTPDGLIDHLISHGIPPHGLITPTLLASITSTINPISRQNPVRSCTIVPTMSILNTWITLGSPQPSLSGTVGGALPIMMLPGFNT